MTAVTQSTWPRKLIAVSSDGSFHFRGRAAEFLHTGVHLQFVESVTEALSQIAKDDSVAAVFVPHDLADMPVADFVRIAQTLGVEVIVGIEPATAQPFLRSLRGGATVKTVMLPASPERLSQTMDAVPFNPIPEQQVLKSGGLELDPTGFTVLWHGRDVQLPAASFYLLNYLMDASPRTVTHQELISTFAAPGIMDPAYSIRKRVSRIRSALEDTLPGVAIPLRTVTRIGYRVVSDTVLDKPGTKSARSDSTYETISSLTRRTS